MNTNSEPSDGLMHELISLVRDNTEKTVAVRSDVNRALALIYQRLIAVESQNAIEAKERPKRQGDLDRTLEKINTRLDGQDTTLEGQDKKLDVIFNQGRRRFWLMVAVLVVCCAAAILLYLLWRHLP